MPSRQELNLRARNVGIDPANYPNDSKLEQRVIYEEKQSATETGALAVGTFTLTDVMQDGETITIGIAGEGQKVYTFVDALTEAKPSATLTVTDVFTEGETVQVGNEVYTFVDALSDPAVANEVLIGASAAASLDNLKSAVNGSAGAGTTYGTGTRQPSNITATTNTDTTQLFVYGNFGTAGNDEPSLESAANASFGGTTFSGGADPVDGEVLIGASAAASLDNLKSAINGSAGAGTTYATGTDAHTEVTATTNTDTTQVVQAISYNSGETIATTETTANGSWGAAALASGTPKVVAKNAVDNAAISGGARV